MQHIFYYFDELLIFFWITLVDILCLKFKSKNYSTKIHITMETSVEIRAKKNTFSLVSDADVKNSCLIAFFITLKLNRYYVCAWGDVPFVKKYLCYETCFESN